MNYEILSIFFTNNLINKQIFKILNLKNVSHLSKLTFDEIYTPSILLRYKSALLLSKFVTNSGILDVIPLIKNEYYYIIQILSTLLFIEKRIFTNWSTSKYILEDPFYPYNWKKNKTKTNYQIMRKHREIMEKTNVHIILNLASKPDLSYIKLYDTELYR